MSAPDLQSAQRFEKRLWLREAGNGNKPSRSSKWSGAGLPVSAESIEMNHIEFRKSPIYLQFRRVVILITGGSVLLIGIALLVLPGPAVVVIPIGLSILALEFAWARRWKRRILVIWQLSKDRLGNSAGRRDPRDSSGIPGP
jgi:hypothetical protein